MAKRIKELEDELLKMKEKDDCLGDLKEEPDMGSKEKSSMERAENLKDFEDLSNDLESQKDVEDVVELNEKIKGAAFWIDPLKNYIDPDVTEVVERSFNIMKKKKLNWRVVKCAKQSGVVECGYYVMRFMRDIILSRSTSIIHIMKDSPRAYTQDDIDCIRSEWVEFVGKHVSLWAEFGVCDYVFLKYVSLWAEFGVCDYVFLKCCVVDHEVLLKCLLDHEILLKCVADHEVLLKCVVDHEVNVMCLCG
ncbi:uncharacterized protein E5676_scaffold242G00160 [Cucumis melo var. makuwa]|uniref:Ubiquitin-like protease family profile domain-containing protein n=1 Tax=Cucumis melo var. makuwa TaxID=1194695 RepID=A0A5D3D842_CUCMM|nr:uncharacterized protein E5676_scaffold242G00160 [Cucumis melo var. makuwa]